MVISSPIQLQSGLSPSPCVPTNVTVRKSKQKYTAPATGTSTSTPLTISDIVPPTVNRARATKKNTHNKPAKVDLWNKIQDAFIPEIMAEVSISNEQSGETVSDINKHSVANSIAIALENPVQPKKRVSSLFTVQNLECVYRSTGARETCDVCMSSVILTDDGFLTCTNPKCSILYKDGSLDQTAEWRYYGADDNQTSDPTRCGMPVNPLLVESSYGCKVMCDGGGYSHDMLKIRRYTEWQSMPYNEKSQYEVFQKITMIAQNNGISKMIIDEALRFHKKISERKTFRGLNRDGIILASIYIACRIHKCPRTVKEIASIFNLDNTSATKGCKNAVAIINELECDLDNSEKTRFSRTKPEAFIDRYCSRLNVNNELTKVCQFIAHIIEKQNLIPENTPHSIAAGIVYFVAQVCNLNITKKDVNKISEISDVTINKCFRKLYAIKDRLIPKIIMDKYGNGSNGNGSNGNESNGNGSNGSQTSYETNDASSGGEDKEEPERNNDERYIIPRMQIHQSVPISVI